MGSEKNQATATAPKLSDERLRELIADEATHPDARQVYETELVIRAHPEGRAGWVREMTARYRT